MKTYPSSILTLLLCAALPCAGQEEQGAGANKADPRNGFTVKPVVLDAKNTEGATVGVQYELKKQWAWNFDQKDAPGRDFDPTATLSDLAVELNGSGTLAASKERNPNKLVDLGVRGFYLRSTSLATFGAGAVVHYETDQSFDDKQFVYGLTAVASKFGLLLPNSFISLIVGYDRVDPKKDMGREGLGVSLDPYNRWNLEGYLNVPLRGKFRSLEFSYRHYQEVSAPAVVEAARLDRHRLGTVRVNLFNDVFVAYSKGSLPFDKTGDRAVTIGWSYKLD